MVIKDALYKYNFTNPYLADDLYNYGMPNSSYAYSCEEIFVNLLDHYHGQIPCSFTTLKTIIHSLTYCEERIHITRVGGKPFYYKD